MMTRYLPYSSRPLRTTLQVLCDLIMIGWTWLWVLIGLAVHAAVSTIAEAGRKVQSGANGVAGNMDSAGDTASKVPLVGDALKKPLTAAGDAAREIAQAGHSIDSTATWLAVLLALAVAAPPILALAMPWLFLRLRFLLRKLTILGLAATPAGIELLALRALANRPLRRLAAVNPDPVGAWRRSDPVTVLGLAALEARSAGISFRALARSQRY
ncbi:MAG: hypothetical protein QOH60_3743 [Mycobacterium sp.]|jgi:hypothetical protein|nr:hypothetical protein [Mycobacterium sp.]